MIRLCERFGYSMQNLQHLALFGAHARCEFLNIQAMTNFVKSIV